MNNELLYRLEYKLETDEWCISFENPIPVRWNAGPFELTLSDGVAVVEMSERYVDDSDARQVVEPYLRSWEIDTMLRMGGEFTLKFVAARVSDRETSTWTPPTSVRVSQVAVEVCRQ